MNVLFLFLIWLLFESASGICDSTSSDVCQLYNNEELPHVYTRHPSIEYSSLTDATEYCDLHALQHGTWYRSSYNLVTTCVDHRQCGTEDPIWLQSSLPSDSDGTVDGTGCVRTFTECCESTINLKIRNCTYFMVYCFVDLHPACHSRFCLDTDLSIETTTVSTTTTTAAAAAAAADSADSSPSVESTKKNDNSVYQALLAISGTGLVVCGVVIGYLIYTRHKIPKCKIAASQLSLCSSQRPHTTSTAREIKIGILNSSDEILGRVQ